MRRTRLLHTALLLSSCLLGWSGCKDAGLGANDTSLDGGSADAAPKAPADMVTPSDNPDLAGLPTLSLSIGPIMLAAGEERTVCRTIPLPTTTPINVLRIDAQLKPGSHHLIIYKSNSTTAQSDPVDCQPLDIGFDGSMTNAVPLYIAETQNQNGLPLPRGTSYLLPAAQMVKIEAHYINASPDPIMGEGDVTLTLAAPTDTTQFIPADIMFCGSVLQLYTQGIPPGVSSLNPGFFQPQSVVPDVKIFGLTTHQHQRGTEMTIAKSTSATDPGTLLDDGKPWDNAPFITYDDNHLLTFQPDEGLRWQCFYDNPDPYVVKFGESAVSNEMCFLWAYYYPSAGHFVVQECIR